VRYNQGDKTVPHTRDHLTPGGKQPMNYNDLPISDKIAMLQLTLDLSKEDIVYIRPECRDPEEILICLAEQAEYLMNKAYPGLKSCRQSRD
jgi:hypothetical protein